jgi:hypothetical protein
MAQPAEAQLVWNASDWKLADFQKVIRNPARIKQVWDIVQIGDGKVLSNIKTLSMASISTMVFLRTDQDHGHASWSCQHTQL